MYLISQGFVEVDRIVQLPSYSEKYKPSELSSEKYKPSELPAGSLVACPPPYNYAYGPAVQYYSDGKPPANMNVRTTFPGPVTAAGVAKAQEAAGPPPTKRTLSAGNDLAGFGALDVSMASSYAASDLEDYCEPRQQSELQPARQRRSFRKKRISRHQAGTDPTSAEPIDRNSRPTKTRASCDNTQNGCKLDCNSTVEPNQSFI